MDQEQGSWLVKVRQALNKEMASRPKQSLAHREDHVERVRKRALEMASIMEEREGVALDLESLEIAALLHDVDQPVHEKANHAELSAVRAEAMLRELGYPEEKIPFIATLVREHSSEDDSPPASLEGKLLFDADKLDGLGALGVARVFVFCGQYGVTPAEAAGWYHKKIAKALPKMQTTLAKELGQESLVFVLDFLKRFEKEWSRFKLD